LSPTLPPIERLPLIPLRGLVVMPNMVASLSIGRERSLAAVEAAITSDRRVVLATQRDGTLEEPGPDGMVDIGVTATLLQTFRTPDGSLRVLLEGKERVTLQRIDLAGSHYQATIQALPAGDTDEGALGALLGVVRDQVTRLIKQDPRLPAEATLALDAVREPARLVDLAAAYCLSEVEERLPILMATDLGARLERLTEHLAERIERLEIDQAVRDRVRTKLERSQREVYLREQLKAIQAELGDLDDKAHEQAEFQQAIARAKLPPHARERAERELARLSRMGSHHPEAGVIRSYLETLTALPWSRKSRDRLDLSRGERVLDEDHHGLAKVKERILEFLAVRALAKRPPATVLCLVGPPGVGKTSLARSIARALSRKFVRASLGGLHDEAEIRGHRRTYVGAMSGRILAGLKEAGTRNPVFLLDELDKLDPGRRGNPAAALLEVLDPEQNAAFHDHYLDVPFDCSDVLFIATANTTHGIPPALLDRLDVVTLAGYTEEEKVAIAERHLFPKLAESHGLDPAWSLHHAELLAVIRGWTREAGVRQLERQLSTLARKEARARLAGEPAGTGSLGDRLGPAPYREAPASRLPEVGTSRGLAWTEHGGSVLDIEVATLPGDGKLTLTGHLGEVMRESAQAAWTYVRSRAAALGIDPAADQERDLHLHVPEGAIPKDGPSAGLALAVAIASALSGRPARSDLALTGEITLRGRVLRVGGIKEKVLAAYRHELAEVLLPATNQDDLGELPAEVLKRVALTPVSSLDEALALALLAVPGRRVESRSGSHAAD